MVIMDLGDLGSTPLSSVVLPPPVIDSSTLPVNAVSGHTYAALTKFGDAWDFAVFKVTDVQNNTSVSLDYIVTNMSVGSRTLNISTNTTLNNASGVGGVAINSGQIFTVDLIYSGSAPKLYGDIDGAGALSIIKSGANPLWFLLGNATHTGGTTVGAGVSFHIGDANDPLTTGSINGNILNNGLSVVFNRRDGVTYAGSISGTGQIGKTVAGDLTFTGTNTHSGLTSISAGRLIAGAANTLSPNSIHFVSGTGILQMDYSQSIAGLSQNGTVNLANSSVLIIGNAAGNTFSGVIQGDGSLVKSGTGTQILTGNNTFTGTTTVTSGTLQLGNGGTTGSVAGGLSVSGAGNLIINRSDNLAQSFTMSGTGNLTKAGAGTLTLNNPISNTGSLIVSGGTLVLGADQVVSKDVSLNIQSVGSGNTIQVNGDTMVRAVSSSNATGLFNIAAGKTLTVRGQGASNTSRFTGGGSLTVGTSDADLIIGAPLTLSHANNDYTGPTLVTGNGTSGGRLRVNGAITASAVTVNGGGELSGFGSVSSLTLGAGSISPGSPGATNQLGNLTVSGNADWHAGASYRWEFRDSLGAAGNNNGWDLITVNDTLNFTSAAPASYTLSVVSLTASNLAGPAENFNSGVGSSFLIAATGGITGFDAAAWSIDTSLFQNAFTGSFSLSQSGNNLYLNYTPSAIPEPSTCVMLAGLAGLGIVLLRRRLVREA